MLIRAKTYTVESVTSGHPDKICDQISDAILDTCLKQDPKSRVAVEVLGSHGLVVIAGEVTTKAIFKAEYIARQIYKLIGYTDRITILTNIVKQSTNIAQGVDTGGAGDQGIMYGYATRETPEYLPKGVVLAHSLAASLERLRIKKIVSWLRPDGKTQVTISNNKLTSVLVSCQHSPEISLPDIKKDINKYLIKPLIGTIDQIEILVNPTGTFISGGLDADSGLTGRKIMVDTYGGLIPHGGGCFSGKDPTKVDRSAAYMARYAAKNLVAHGYGNECLVSVAYAIGRAEPLMLEAVNETGRSFSGVVRKKYDFRPRAIIERLNLLQPIYFKTAAYGHFTKKDLPWEQID